MSGRELLESNDVARELRLSPSTVRVLVAAGHLRPSARTRRGTALFTQEEVERVRRERERRRSAIGA